MKQGIKRFAAACFALLLLAGLTGCTAAPLPDGFDADAVTARAEEVVALSTAGEYDAVIGMLREDLKSAVTAEQLDEGWASIYEKAGAFESVTKVVLSGTSDKTTGEEYAVAQVLVKHADASLIYTLSFDADLALVGLYLK